MLNIPSTKSKRISGTGRKAWWPVGWPSYRCCPSAWQLLEPNMGFGNAWRNETGLKVRERLGWAVTSEVSGDGAIQAFYNGLMLWYKPTKEIFVAYRYHGRTNVWETYPDTFVG